MNWINLKHLKDFYWINVYEFSIIKSEFLIVGGCRFWCCNYFFFVDFVMLHTNVKNRTHINQIEILHTQNNNNIWREKVSDFHHTICWYMSDLSEWSPGDLTRNHFDLVTMCIFLHLFLFFSILLFCFWIFSFYHTLMSHQPLIKYNSFHLNTSIIDQKK